MLPYGSAVVCFPAVCFSVASCCLLSCGSLYPAHGDAVCIPVASAQLLKCICSKYTEGSQHLATLAARIEAVWVVQFTFGQQPTQQATQQGQQPTQQATQQAQQSTQQGQQQHGHHQPTLQLQPPPQPSASTTTATYGNLASVNVAPAFPTSKLVSPDGVICTNIDKAVKAVTQLSNPTLAALLAHASAATMTAPPPGFILLVQYVDKLCGMYGIQIATPKAEYSRSAGGSHADDTQVDLSSAAVVHLGAKSLVLRLPGFDSVLKVAAQHTIQHELRMHRVIDLQQCASLRPLVDLRHGDIKGAGDGLEFLELQHWCEPASDSAVVRNLDLFWTQVWWCEWHEA